MNEENDPLIEALQAEADKTRPAFSTELRSRILDKVNAERAAALKPAPKSLRLSLRRYARHLAIAALMLLGVIIYSIESMRSQRGTIEPQQIVKDFPAPDNAVKPIAITNNVRPSARRATIAAGDSVTVKLLPLSFKIGLPIAIKTKEPKQRRHVSPDIARQIAAFIEHPAGGVDSIVIDLLPSSLRK